MRAILLCLLALLSLAALSLSILALRAEKGVSLEILEGSGAVRFEKRGLVYVYHPMTGTEALYAVDEDPKLLHNLLAKRPADAMRLRVELCDRLGVGDLRELRNSDDPIFDALRGLGYL